MDRRAGATTTPEASTETLVVGRTGDIDNLDPHLATAFQTIDALELVFDSLTELDPDLTVQPGLATEWAYNDDGTELTFTLREGDVPRRLRIHVGGCRRFVGARPRRGDRRRRAWFPALDRRGHRPRRPHRRAQPVDGRCHAAAALSRVGTSILSADDIAAGYGRVLAHEVHESVRVLLPILREALKVGEHRINAALAEQLHGVLGVLVEVGVEDALVLKRQAVADIEEHPAKVVQS